MDPWTEFEIGLLADTDSKSSTANTNLKLVPARTPLYVTAGAPIRYTPDPRLLVGVETGDDAGVLQLSDELALVQTVDFITPISDDPYEFGAMLHASAAQAQLLQKMLSEGDAEAVKLGGEADRALRRIDQNCSACHSEYRNR